MTTFPAPHQIQRREYSDPSSTNRVEQINIIPPSQDLLSKIGFLRPEDKNKAQALLDRSPASMEVWKLLTEHGIEFVESQVEGNLAPCLKINDTVYTGLEEIRTFVTTNYPDKIKDLTPPLLALTQKPVKEDDDSLISLANWVK